MERMVSFALLSFICSFIWVAGACTCHWTQRKQWLPFFSTEPFPRETYLQSPWSLKQLVTFLNTKTITTNSKTIPKCKELNLGIQHLSGINWKSAQFWSFQRSWLTSKTQSWMLCLSMWSDRLKPLPPCFFLNCPLIDQVSRLTKTNGLQNSGSQSVVLGPASPRPPGNWWG